MKKTFIINIFLILTICIFAVAPFVALAQAPAGGVGSNPARGSGGDLNFRIKIDNPFNCTGTGCTLTGFVRQIINELVLPIGGVISVLMIMYAGFLYVTAGPNENKVKNAHNALLWGVVGAAILLGAWIISEAVQGTIDQIRR